jgi:hypothetical protein
MKRTYSKFNDMSENNEMIWQELVESKDFDQLTNAEKAVVLAMSTEANYRLERAAILEAQSIYVTPEPRPLIIEEEKKGIVIPLYQAILAVAAAFVLGFFLFKTTQTLPSNEKVEPIAETDTVWVENRIIDTVIQTKIEYVQLAAKSPSPNKEEPSEEKTSPVAEESISPSAILVNQISFETDLSSATLANKGTSASKDETFIFIDEWVAPN